MPRVMLSEGVKPLNKAVRQELTENDRRLRRALVAFFARRVQTLPEAEDLTQDVFFRIIRDPKREAPMADAYVFRIAANLLRDKGRRERVRTSYREARAIEDFLGIDPLDPHRVAEGRENLDLVARTIAELPENIDKRTIAESFGLSVRMVEIHVQRALEALATSMEAFR